MVLGLGRKPTTAQEEPKREETAAAQGATQSAPVHATRVFTDSGAVAHIATGLPAHEAAAATAAESAGLTPTSHAPTTTSSSGGGIKGAVESAAAGIASLLGGTSAAASTTTTGTGTGAHPHPHVHLGAEGGREEPLPGALGGAGYAGDVGGGRTGEEPDVHGGHQFDAATAAQVGGLSMSPPRHGHIAPTHPPHVIAVTTPLPTEQYLTSHPQPSPSASAPHRHDKHHDEKQHIRDVEPPSSTATTTGPAAAVAAGGGEASDASSAPTHKAPLGSGLLGALGLKLHHTATAEPATTATEPHHTAGTEPATTATTEHVTGGGHHTTTTGSGKQEPLAGYGGVKGTPITSLGHREHPVKAAAQEEGGRGMGMGAGAGGEGGMPGEAELMGGAAGTTGSSLPLAGDSHRGDTGVAHHGDVGSGTGDTGRSTGDGGHGVSGGGGHGGGSKEIPCKSSTGGVLGALFGGGVTTCHPHTVPDPHDVPEGAIVPPEPKAPSGTAAADKPPHTSSSSLSTTSGTGPMMTPAKPLDKSVQDQTAGPEGLLHHGGSATSEHTRGGGGGGGGTGGGLLSKALAAAQGGTGAGTGGAMPVGSSEGGLGAKGGHLQVGQEPAGPGELGGGGGVEEGHGGGKSLLEEMVETVAGGGGEGGGGGKAAV